MIKFFRKDTWLVALFAVIVALGGCATTGADKNFAMQVEAYSAGQRAVADVAKAKADADRARFDAIAEIGKTGDPTTKIASVLALAMGNASTATTGVQPSSSPLPSLPESDSDKAFKWASMFLGPMTNVAQGLFGYKLGVVQSNNQTAMSIANTNAFASTAAAGFGANTSIASAGFATAGSIATQGFGAASSIAQSGFGSATSIAGLIQAPAPNLTLAGTGVIGSGSYSAPITRNCTGGNAAAGNAAGSGTTGQGGSSGTTGQAGSSGSTGAGGPGPAGNGGAAGC